MQTAGVWESFDGVNHKIRDRLKNLSSLHENQSDVGRTRFGVDSLFGNLLVMESKRRSGQCDQINLIRLGVAANEGKTSAGDLSKTAKLDVRLTEIGGTLFWDFDERPGWEDEVGERCQAIVDLVHGPPTSLACSL
jgi:hypothetical protein